MEIELEEFEKQLNQLKDQFLPHAEIKNVDRRLNSISLRIQISEDLFIDVYYNTDSDRLDFTTIKDDQRIFGYDNLSGWHYHPYENPEEHRPCTKPTIEEIFEETVQVIGQITSQGDMI